MTEKLHCFGCGSELQTTDENAVGYIPSHLLETHTTLLCRRCFRLQHYGQNTQVDLSNETFRSLLAEIDSKRCLVVYVFDLLNFFGSVIDNLVDYIRNNPILVVVNKIDLLPKSISMETVRKWTEKRLNELHIPYIGIELVSSEKNQNLDSLFAAMTEHRHGRDVYVIGNANVGKSSLINSILRNYPNDTSHFITSSRFPGTTLHLVQIPFDNSSFLFDTPGLLSQTSIVSAVDDRNLRYLLTNKEIKPISFQLLPKQSILIGSLGRIDFTEGKPTTFIFFVSPRVKLHRTKAEQASDKLNKFMNDPLYIPKAKAISSSDQLIKQTIILPKHPRSSIYIDGLGVIDVLHGGQTVDLYLPNHTNVSIHESLIGGEQK